MSFSQWMSGHMFKWVHGHYLIYNTCWEDPRIDREALALGPDDTVMVITSAGCNALDYALQAPKHVYAVDMNYRQNALLELKQAGVRSLDFDQFFAMFGRGRLEGFERVYGNALRPQLSVSARAFWDKRLRYFDGGRGDSFYFHGTSGMFAWLLNYYLDHKRGLRDQIEQILAAKSVEEQQAIYYGGLHDSFWSRLMNWLANRDTTLAMVGVPREQRVQVERHYQGGVAQFARECLEAVFAYLPLGDNYFWRVYLTGQYTEDCCPEYLKRDNFMALKEGLVDRVSVHTNTITNFLRNEEVRISRYVLLDHMDWLSAQGNELLRDEWQAIVDKAAAGTRILWRSGGLHTDFVDPVEVALGGSRWQVGDLLHYHTDWAADLHQYDRVHTYGSFYIADLAES